MGEIDFLRKLGFSAHPFDSIDADDEDRLDEYFVAPTYFESIWGDPDNPNPCVVFASRGAGKTAQRRIIEERANKNNVFVISYTRFEGLNPSQLASLSVDYHLRNILRIGTLGLLLEIYNRQLSLPHFSSPERQNILSLFREYLGEMTQEEALRAAKGLKTVGQKAKEWLATWSKPISVAASAVLTAKGMPVDVDLSVPTTTVPRPSVSLKMQFDWFRDLVLSLGLRSIYLLIDKVDEADLTGNNAENSFDLVKPLLRDLELLGTKKIGFKLFLWDAINSYYVEYGRPDRVYQPPTLRWTIREIKQMLSERLKAFSNKSISQLDQIVSARAGQSLDSLVVQFAQCCPRDVIRVCKYIVSEHLKRNPDARRLDVDTAMLGVSAFADKRAKEIVKDEVLQILKQMKKVSFTARDFIRVFGISEYICQLRLKEWKATELIVPVSADLGEFQQEYALADIRVAKAMFPEMPLKGFLFAKVWDCQHCGVSLIREWGLRPRSKCHACGGENVKG